MVEFRIGQTQLACGLTTEINLPSAGLLFQHHRLAARRQSPRQRHVVGGDGRAPRRRQHTRTGIDREDVVCTVQRHRDAGRCRDVVRRRRVRDGQIPVLNRQADRTGTGRDAVHAINRINREAVQFHERHVAGRGGDGELGHVRRRVRDVHGAARIDRQVCRNDSTRSSRHGRCRVEMNDRRIVRQVQVAADRDGPAGRVANDKPSRRDAIQLRIGQPERSRSRPRQDIRAAEVDQRSSRLRHEGRRVGTKTDRCWSVDSYTV